MTVTQTRVRGRNLVHFFKDNCNLNVFVLLTHAVLHLGVFCLVCTNVLAGGHLLLVASFVSWFEKMAERPVARAPCVTEGSVQF